MEQKLKADTEGVGKSTIVTSLIKESYMPHVCPSNPARLHLNNVIIGSAYCTRNNNSTRGHCSKCDHVHRGHGLYVSDSMRPCSHNPTRLPARADDRTHLDSEIRKAHVICVVYAIDNPHSFDRIPTYWLPYFRQLGVNVCIICVSSFNI